MLPFRMFAASHSRTGFPHLRPGVSRVLRGGPFSSRFSPIPEPCPPTSSIPFRINTCKSVTKQTALIIFRINTYEKHRGEGVLLLTSSLFPSTFADHEPVSPLFATHTDSHSRKSFICHSYENMWGVHQLFRLWNSAPAPTWSESHSQRFSPSVLLSPRCARLASSVKEPSP
jgi:hypothetical protein